MNKNTICLVTFLVCLISLSTNLSYALSPKPLQVNDYYSKLTPLKEHSKTSREIIKDLQKLHYRQQEINDKLSSKIFDSYLSALDPEKIFFLSRDIDEFRTYKFELDNALRSGNIAPAFDMFNRYHKYMTEMIVYSINFLERGMET